MQQLPTGEDGDDDDDDDDDGRIGGSEQHKSGGSRTSGGNIGGSDATVITSATASSSSSSYQCFEGTFQDFIHARKEAADTAANTACIAAATDDDDLGSFHPLTSSFDILVREWVAN